MGRPALLFIASIAASSPHFHAERGEVGIHLHIDLDGFIH